MDQVQTAILSLLQQQAVGNANAMNVDQIYNALVAQNIPVIQGRTQEHVRTSVRSLVKAHGLLIGSKSGFGSNNGYYIINSKDEVIDTIMNLVGRSRSMLNRVDALKQTWNLNNPQNKL
jgi:hypothetical protein